MSNQLSHLLQQWYPERDQCDWVLGTIYKHHGPCYRKAGAMMLFNSLGQQFGMLSGGCLESDIAKNARKVMLSGQSVTVCYDGSDEDDLSFQLGIGCGGTVYIMLQLINANNQYLALDKVFHGLAARQAGVYHQKIPEKSLTDESRFELINAQHTTAKSSSTSKFVNSQYDIWIATLVSPEPHLLVAGGGLDARPMVAIAHQLGWRVSLWDPRPANARKEYFLTANQIIKGDEQALHAFAQENQIDAAVVMTHNINLDAKAVAALLASTIRYLALLGPSHRKQQVLKQAKLLPSSFTFPIAGPAGLNIGGELPESIALSILSECHACLQGKSARSISEVLDRALQKSELQLTA